jgi:hypothetical protein
VRYGLKLRDGTVSRFFSAMGCKRPSDLSLFKIRPFIISGMMATVPPERFDDWCQNQLQPRMNPRHPEFLSAIELFTRLAAAAAEGSLPPPYSAFLGTFLIVGVPKAVLGIAAITEPLQEPTRGIVIQLVEQIGCLYPVVLKLHARQMESIFMTIFAVLFFESFPALAQTDAEKDQMLGKIWDSVAIPLVTWLLNTPFNNQRFEFFTSLTAQVGCFRGVDFIQKMLRFGADCTIGYLTTFDKNGEVTRKLQNAFQTLGTLLVRSKCGEALMLFECLLRFVISLLKVANPISAQILGIKLFIQIMRELAKPQYKDNYFSTFSVIFSCSEFIDYVLDPALTVDLLDVLTEYAAFQMPIEPLLDIWTRAMALEHTRKRFVYSLIVNVTLFLDDDDLEIIVAEILNIFQPDDHHLKFVQDLIIRKKEDQKLALLFDYLIDEYPKLGLRVFGRILAGHTHSVLAELIVDRCSQADMNIDFGPILPQLKYDFSEASLCKVLQGNTIQSFQAFCWVLKHSAKKLNAAAANLLWGLFRTDSKFVEMFVPVMKVRARITSGQMKLISSQAHCRGSRFGVFFLSGRHLFTHLS